MAERVKARVKATGEIVEVALRRKLFDFEPDILTDLNVTDMYGHYVKFYHPEELEPVIVTTPHPEETITGWVARDGNGTLFVHKTRPFGGMYYKNAPGSPPGELLVLPKDSFPSLTWQDEPIEVEITIKPKESK